MKIPLKLGFLGGGLNSAVGRCHQIASTMDREWEIVAGAFSRDPSVNEATATEWGISEDRTYGSLETFVEGEGGRIDAVCVLTPTPAHAEQISALLNAGFNVISEKALAGTSREAEALGRLAGETGRFLRVTMNYSGYPMVRELRQMIRLGRLGRVHGIHVEMPQEGFLKRDAQGNQIQPQAWRRRDGEVPTVALDLGTHTHHLIAFLLGSEPDRVVGTQAHHGNVTHVADYVSCLAKTSDDIDVSMWFGKTVLGQRNGLSVEVYGDLGAAQWVQANPEEIRFADSRGDVRILDRSSPGIEEAAKGRYQRFKAGHPAGFLEAFANLYVDLARDLKSWLETSETPQTSYTFGAEHAARGLRMLEGIAESQRRGTWITIPAAGGARVDSA